MKKPQILASLALVALIILVAIGLIRRPAETSAGDSHAEKAVAAVTLAPTEAPQEEKPAVVVETLPDFLTDDFLSASLAALKQNGSDLALPMPSKHLVRCETPAIADRMIAWGRANGFEAAEPTVFLGHGGVEFFDVELRRTEVPDPARIQQQGRQVLGEVARTEGAEYATWVGEIVGR